VLYITNNSSGQVTVAFFDKVTGTLSKGCISAPLKGFYNTWGFAGGMGLQSATGTGGLLYIPEIGSPPSIGVVKFTRTANSCNLIEVASSPVTVPGLSAVPLSIDTYPARPF
jgi:hypothetical protein